MARPSDVSREHGAEHEQNRPYRRFVTGVFFALLAVVAVLVLRGIIRKLDRLPSIHTMDQADVVDTRALRACAEDLLKLEERVRDHAGIALGRDPSEASSWPQDSERLEEDRLRVVARCRLHEDTDDPVAADLKVASEGIEDLLRAYNLLINRFKSDGKPASEDSRKAIQRALEALKSR